MITVQEFIDEILDFVMSHCADEDETVLSFVDIGEECSVEDLQMFIDDDGKLAVFA